MKSSVPEKGQVTIPKPSWESFGIKPGEVDAVYGILKLEDSTDTLLKKLRGDTNGI